MNRFENTDTKEKYYIPMSDEEFEKILETMKCPLDQAELWTRELNIILKNISDNTNNKYTQDTKNLNKKDDREKYRTPELVNKDCTVRMEGSQIKECGPFSKEEIKDDMQWIADCENKWSNGQGAEAFREAKTKTHGDLWEKALTVIFHKILGSDFLVVRASKYDDLKNGIDTFLVNADGDIICALDEVSTEKGSDLAKIKSQKAEEKNKLGGAKIKYGLSFDKNKNIVKKSIKNIPMFYMRLSGEKLVELLKEIHLNPHESKVSNIEFEIFDSLIASLEKQIIEENDNEKIPDKLKQKMKQLSNSLEKMKKIRDKKIIENE